MLCLSLFRILIMNISGFNIDAKSWTSCTHYVLMTHTVSGFPPTDVNLSHFVMYAACLDFCFPLQFSHNCSLDCFLLCIQPPREEY